MHGQVNCPIWSEAPACGKHELGINLFSWINLDLEQVIHRDGDMPVANGLLYKLHCGRNVFRAGADLFRYRYEEGARPDPEESIYPWYSYAEGRYQDFALRLGYERRLTKGRLQPFVGVDLSYRLLHKVGHYEGRGDFPPYEYAGETDETWSGYHAGPLVGVAYAVGEHLSVSVEGCVQMGSQRMVASKNGFRSSDRSYLIADPIRTFAVSYLF